MYKPFVVHLGQFTRFDQSFDGVVRQFFHGHVILANHDGNGFHAQHFADDFKVGRILGGCNIARQNLTIHHKRIGTARLKQQKAVGMVFAKDFFKVNTGGALMLAQQLHRGSAGGGCHVFTIQLPNAGDAAVGLDRNAYLFNIGRHDKRHVFLACRVVGGRATFNVHGAVLHQGDAVLRRHRCVFHFQFFPCSLLDRSNDALADFYVVTRIFAIAQGVRQGARRVAYPHGDAARGLDLGKGVVGLRHGAGTRDGQNGQCDQLLFHGFSLSVKKIRNFNNVILENWSCGNTLVQHELV